MRTLSICFAASTLLVVIAACSGDTKTCNPGQSQSCTCGGGGYGGQTCTSDGLGWNDCVCDGNPPSNSTSCIAAGQAYQTCGCGGPSPDGGNTTFEQSSCCSGNATEVACPSPQCNDGAARTLTCN